MTAGHRSAHVLFALAALWFNTHSAGAFVSAVTDTNTWQVRKWNLLTPSPFLSISTNVLNLHTHALRYFLSADAWSATNRVAELNAARACYAQWQAVPGSIVRFEEGGLISGNADINTSDNTNVVFWAKTSTMVNGGLDNIYGITGATFASFFSDGTLAEADIVLNGVPGVGGFTWFTDFNNTETQSYFVESVLLHEIGHFLGLAHSPVGSATMFTRGGPGVNTQAGLSADDIAFVHTLYPAATNPPPLAGIKGRITQQGIGVLGAIVLAEDSAGNIASGTVTRGDGQYALPSLPPGNYQVRATPLDGANLPYTLFRGYDVAPAWTSANPSFAPTTNTPVTLTAGSSITLNFAVSGAPSIRIGRIRPPSVDPAIVVLVNYAEAFPAGASDVVVGLYSLDPLTSNAVLRVTGDGLTLGQTTLSTNPIPGLPLELLSVPVHVDPSATPGMRSLIVQDGSSLGYVNGFFEIPTPIPDFNFDGLDDRFQRRYFPLWTAPQAGPLADPDGDSFNNKAEYLFDSDPTNPASVPRIQSVQVDASGATITWPSAPFQHYQVLTRPRLDSSRGWQPLGGPVLSTGQTTQFLDTSAGGEFRFYRVEAVP